MESDILNTRHPRVRSRFDETETNEVEPEFAVDEKRGACAGTIYIPAWANEAAGSVYIEISTSVSGAGTVRIGREGGATLLWSNAGNVFLTAGAQNNPSSGEVLFEELVLPEAFEPAA